MTNSVQINQIRSIRTHDYRKSEEKRKTTDNRSKNDALKKFLMEN